MRLSNSVFMIKFGFHKEVEVKGVGKAFFARLMGRVEEVLRVRIKKMLMGRDGRLDVILVGDCLIHEINKEYRGKDKPTDVISFAFLDVADFEGTKGDIIVGDVFISVDTARRQAVEKGHSFKNELEVLFVHGVLHCLGFDHNNDEEEAEMEGWAEKVLSGK